MTSPRPLTEPEVRDRPQVPDYKQSPGPHILVERGGGQKGMPRGRAVLSGVVGEVAEDTQAFGVMIYSGSSALLLLPLF